MGQIVYSYACYRLDNCLVLNKETGCKLCDHSPKRKREMEQFREFHGLDIDKEQNMETCQYCGEGPFPSALGKKIHEQQYCSMKPEEVEPVEIPSPDTQGQSGHAIDKDAYEEWCKRTGRETRLQFLKPDPNFQVSVRLIEKFNRVIKAREDEPQMLYLVGDSGTGKTSLALQFAAITKSPTYKAPCPAMSEVSQWMGRTEFSPERGTFYIPSLFIEAIETEGAVVILNDITRVENPKVLNPLMDILDEAAQTYSEELGRMVKVAKGVVFIATANEGWEYVGADDPDRAMKQRFSVIHMKPPSTEILTKIIQSKVGSTPEIRAGIDFFLECIKRGIPLSIRHALRLTKDIRLGASLVDAALLGMLGDLDDEKQRDALQILQVKTGLTSEQLEVSDEWRVWNGNL